MHLPGLIQSRLRGFYLGFSVNDICACGEHLKIRIAHRVNDKFQSVAIRELRSLQVFNGRPNTLVLRETGVHTEIGSYVEIRKWADHPRNTGKFDSSSSKVYLLHALANLCRAIRQHALQGTPTLATRSSDSLLAKQCTEVRFQTSIDGVLERDRNDLVSRLVSNDATAKRI